MNMKKILRLIGCLSAAALLVFVQFMFIDYFDEQELLEHLRSQELSLTVGDSVSCGDLLLGSDFNADELNWSAEGECITVDGDFLECLSSGEAVITAKKNGKTVVRCDVNIISRSVISLDSNYTVIGEGLTVQIQPRVSGISDADFDFISENPLVASVDENGLITALSDGEGRIKISSYGCDSVYFDINVSNSPSEVILSERGLVMGVGESSVLKASLPEGSYDKIAPVFASSDEKVASVDSDGVVTAVGVGKCEITATAYSGASSACSVEVGKAPSSVSITIGDDFLYAGETVTAKVKISDGSVCSKYKFESSNPAVASVSDDGVITGKGRGTATITVSTYNGKKASCKISAQIFDYMTSPTSKDVLDAVGYLAEFYPDLISTEKIGTSVKGKDIMLLKLGKGSKKACVVAGLHAKEDIAVVFTMRCIEEYAEAYCSATGKYGSYNLRKMLNEYTLYIVPLMNPDGLDIVNAGEMPLYTDKLSDSVREKYKSNANGVNLNRNFPFRWDQIISSPTEPDEADYRGDSEGSEPETQAIVKLVENNDFEWLFSMHCKGNFIYWADQYNKINSFDQKLAYRLKDNCEFGLKAPSPVKNLGGGLENWFRYKTGKPGFCVELVKPEYSTDVNKYFAVKTNWTKTKYVFIQAMRQ